MAHLSLSSAFLRTLVNPLNGHLPKTEHHTRQRAALKFRCAPYVSDNPISSCSPGGRWHKLLRALACSRRCQDRRTLTLWPGPAHPPLHDPQHVHIIITCALRLESRIPLQQKRLDHVIGQDQACTRPCGRHTAQCWRTLSHDCTQLFRSIDEHSSAPVCGIGPTIRSAATIKVTPPRRHSIFDAAMMTTTR